MKELLNSPTFGIILSILAYEIGLWIYRKSRIPLLNPLLISIGLVIGVLLISGIGYDTYNKGGAYISFFLTPATVILAVPLYKQLDNLKANLLPILAGIVTGSMVALTSVCLMVRLLGVPRELGLSLVPKSVTTPIGLEISKQLGGIPPVTVVAIIVTGIMGAVMAPSICRVFGITDNIARGISIGTSSHALGTTKALEMGETEGAMSGLAIGVAGLLTVFLAPLAVWLFAL